MLVNLTDENFMREVLESDVPVVIDFWAPTCVPCKAQEPSIRKLASELAGRAKVGRLDVYDNPQTTEQFRVRGVPHLAVVRGGEVVLELVGGHSLEQLRTKVTSALASA